MADSIRKDKYTIGVDFGTLSGRAVLVRVRDGKVIAEASKAYPHGVIEKELPLNDAEPVSEEADPILPQNSGADAGITQEMTVSLPQSWALEDPADYEDVLFSTIQEVLHSAAGVVAPEDIIGIAVDTTSMTLIPVDQNGTPLSFLPQFRNHPHAWCKLWKHHSAQPQADRMTALARKKGEAFIECFGGKISSEWMLPKAIEIFEEDPAVYEAADLFLDACDYLVYRMTGTPTANICSASFKAQYNKQSGYLSADFVKELCPGLETIASSKLRAPVIPLGSRAGTLTAEAAAKCGLVPGIAVAAGNVDAHVSVPGAGISKTNELLMIIGTSICSMICSTDAKTVPGMCGCVEDGILPGLYGYEAGQPCAGDCLAWYTGTQVPKSYMEAAAEKNLSVHEYLTALASRKRPGENGLLVLDWWNGNRSVLNNAGLSGLVLGYTLDTKPEDVYRALIEANAYGMRRIRDNFVQNGVAVNKVYACGGISFKNSMFMQIFADVLNSDIYVSPCLQTPALGCAMFASVAAGATDGGYDTIYDAIEHMADRGYIVYHPIAENVPLYERLYEQYVKVHDFFGVEAPEIMSTLKSLSKNAD